jgi:putative transposase
MSGVVTVGGDTGPVAKREPAKPDVHGVDARLVGRARSAGVPLTGEGGLLEQLTSGSWSRR